MRSRNDQSRILFSLSYRQRHGDEAEEQVGDGQVDDEDVAGRPHGRLAGHDVDDQRVADGPEDDEDAIGGDQAEEGEVVDASVGAEPLDDRQVELEAFAGRVGGVACCGRGRRRRPIEEQGKIRRIA